MYRPTVRYDDVYKKYVDSLFQSTTLDRNQIIRLALFAAPFSTLFNAQIKKHMTSPLPQAFWEVEDHGLWIGQQFIKEEKRRDVNGESEKIWWCERQPVQRKEQPIERRIGEIHNEQIKLRNRGGIKITIG